MNPVADEGRRVIGLTGHRPQRLGLWTRLTLPWRLRRRMVEMVDEGGSARPILLTSLAEGVDRIGARAALRLGWTFEVVLPFPGETYLADFKSEASRREFTALLGRARRVHVMPTGQAGYLGAGLEILARSDVLLAVLDGGGSRGVGGASDLVERAVASGRRISLLRVPRVGLLNPAWD